MYTPTTVLAGEFAGRPALVTGGSRGMGVAIAQRLLDGGAAVVTSARSSTAHTPTGSTFIAADLRSESAAVDKLIPQLQARRQRQLRAVLRAYGEISVSHRLGGVWMRIEL
jgi:NAD(P)-dependent dehydrogenase (short-subunit alcohol dehydrogenase family)